MEERLPTKFVVGLGNPERRYQGTRHNVGFMVLKELRGRWDFGRARRKFHGKCWSGRIAGQAVTLLAPETYMNRSGLAVAEMIAFYKADPAAALVVMDDMALPTGRLRARARGSAGGHKGLDDILRAVGTHELPRLRVGVGAPPEAMARFEKHEKPVMLEAIRRAVAAVEGWLAQGIAYVMNRYNQNSFETTNDEQDRKS